MGIPQQQLCRHHLFKCKANRIVCAIHRTTCSASFLRIPRISSSVCDCCPQSGSTRSTGDYRLVRLVAGGEVPRVSRQLRPSIHSQSFLSLLAITHLRTSLNRSLLLWLDCDLRLPVPGEPVLLVPQGSSQKMPIRSQKPSLVLLH